MPARGKGGQDGLGAAAVAVAAPKKIAWAGSKAAPAPRFAATIMPGCACASARWPSGAPQRAVRPAAARLQTPWPRLAATDTHRCTSCQTTLLKLGLRPTGRVMGRSGQLQPCPVLNARPKRATVGWSAAKVRTREFRHRSWRNVHLAPCSREAPLESRASCANHHCIATVGYSSGRRTSRGPCLPLPDRLSLRRAGAPCRDDRAV